MSRLILAEKPSVCRDIANVIGAKTAKKMDNLTYYEGNGYIVSNFRGHLVGLAEPDEYYPELRTPENLSKSGMIFWNKIDLPIVPEKYVFVPNDKDCKAHISAIAKLMKLPEVDTIICGTDAGREGELIFRYVYNYIGCKKPVKRLWISSLTNESIQDGINKLLDGNDKNGMFIAGDCRNKADWLIGMNLTRLYSMLYKMFPLNVGRVFTPTLRMIVDRDNEISSFSKRKYYTLNLDNGAEYFIPDGENTFSEKLKADSIAQNLNGKTVTVTSAETKRKSENRPQLHSLTSAQKEANEKYGLTADETLTALQSLYEKKLTTYPRTDSNCITDDMKNTIPDLVRAVELFTPQRTKKLLSQGLNLDKRVVDNTKVSDHHAVIPTKEIEKITTMDLTDNEKKIAELIINRFLLALDLPYYYFESEYIFSVNGEQFKLTSKIPDRTALGWRSIEPPKNDKSKEPVSYSQGDTFTAVVSVAEKETSPPKPFTESTLLSAMENISRRIDDKEKAEFVKERGLGTPATRAGIIEKLIKFGFAQRKGKNFISTQKGRDVVKVLPEEVKSVEMTADMEEKLADIESGKLSADIFLSEIESFIKNRISAENGKVHQSLSPQKEREIIGKCPKCGKNIVEVNNPKLQAFCCENKECKFILWKKQFGNEKAVNKTTAKQLLTKRKSGLVKGFISKAGKEYSAFLVMKNDFSIGLDF